MTFLTPSRAFTKLRMARFGAGKYRQPHHFTLKEAVKNCAAWKRKAERMAREMVKGKRV